MDSDSSVTSDNGFEFLDNKNNKVDNVNSSTNETSTNNYFDLLANPEKTMLDDVNENDSVSDIISELSDDDTEVEDDSDDDSDTDSRKKNKSKADDSSSGSGGKLNNMFSNIINKSRSNSNNNFQDTVKDTERRTERRPSGSKYDIKMEETTTYETTTDVVKEPVKTYTTPGEIRMRKIELLRGLSELKAKGFELTKNYDFNSSLEEMEYEYDLIKSFADKQISVKKYKELIVNGVSIIEFFNGKIDLLDLKLKGWSEHMRVEVDNYDDILAEIYEKYKGVGGNTPPEMKLLLMVLLSGAAFHMSNSMGDSMPGNMMRGNPGFISSMMKGPEQRSRFVSPQEANIQKMKQNFSKPDASNMRRTQEVNKIFEGLNLDDDMTMSDDDRVINSKTVNKMVI